VLAIETPDPSIPRTASRHIPISHKIIATETPFQRWRNSPPEDEASVEAIKRTSLTMKYHDSLGYSDPDSGMVSDEILRHGSVASSIGSVSSSMSSRLSAQSSLSLASHNLRRKRKGRRRLYHARSHVTQDKIFVNIECRHCQEHITSSLQTTWEDGKSVIEKIDCPKCSRHIFRGDMSKNNIRTNVFCRTCGCGVDQVRLLQLKYPDQQAFTCHRCLEHLFTIIIGDLPASITALTTPRHEDSEDGRQATSPPRFETRFDCTFCPATFKSRYTWERHETSIHCPQELWICMAAGPTIITNSGSACVFCNLENPTHNHLAKHHNFAACFQRKLSERTFERKDGLQQHLKGVHNQHVISPYMLVHWSQNSMAGPQQWTCGICPAVFSDWNTRLKHIGHHWENGLDMTDWVHRDPWGDIQVDHHAAPRTQASEQHSLIHNNPELPRTAVLGYSASQHLENFRRPIQRSESSATQARPASKPAATFTWKGLFRRLSSA
jgi:hypothetical protein